jgi:hypothetical protein
LVAQTAKAPEQPLAHGNASSSPLGRPEATIPPELVDLEATVAVQAAIIATLEARVAELERRLGKDSSISSRAAVLGWPSKAHADPAAR